MSIKQKTEDLHRELITNALKATEGNVSATASRLEMPIRSLYNIMHALKINPNDFRQQNFTSYGKEQP